MCTRLHQPSTCRLTISPGPPLVLATVLFLCNARPSCPGSFSFSGLPPQVESGTYPAGWPCFVSSSEPASAEGNQQNRLKRDPHGVARSRLPDSDATRPRSPTHRSSSGIPQLQSLEILEIGRRVFQLKKRLQAAARSQLLMSRLRKATLRRVSQPRHPVPPLTLLAVHLPGSEEAIPSLPLHTRPIVHTHSGVS